MERPVTCWILGYEESNMTHCPIYREWSGERSIRRVPALATGSAVAGEPRRSGTGEPESDVGRSVAKGEGL